MLFAAFSQYFFGISIFVSSLFLILLVLVQRGRGGGLTGALGGPGGQSAFGTKAGDLFTRITVGVAVVWILLCAASVYFLKARALPTFGDGTSNTADASGTMGGVDLDSDDTTDSLTPDGTPDVTGLGIDPLAPSNSESSAVESSADEGSAAENDGSATDEAGAAAEVSDDEGLQLGPESDEAGSSDESNGN